MIWGDALSSLVNTVIFSVLVIFFTKDIIRQTMDKHAGEPVAV